MLHKNLPVTGWMWVRELTFLLSIIFLFTTLHQFYDKFHSNCEKDPQLRISKVFLIYLRQYRSHRSILVSKSTCGKVISWILEKKWWKMMWHLCMELFFSKINNNVHLVMFTMWIPDLTCEHPLQHGKKIFSMLSSNLNTPLVPITSSPACWKNNAF